MCVFVYEDGPLYVYAYIRVSYLCPCRYIYVRTRLYMFVYMRAVFFVFCFFVVVGGGECVKVKLIVCAYVSTNWCLKYLDQTMCDDFIHFRLECNPKFIDG